MCRRDSHGRGCRESPAPEQEFDQWHSRPGQPRNGPAPGNQRDHPPPEQNPAAAVAPAPPSAESPQFEPVSGGRGDRDQRPGHRAYRSASPLCAESEPSAEPQTALVLAYYFSFVPLGCARGQTPLPQSWIDTLPRNKSMRTVAQVTKQQHQRLKVSLIVERSIIDSYPTTPGSSGSRRNSAQWSCLFLPKQSPFHGRI